MDRIRDTIDPAGRRNAEVPILDYHILMLPVLRVGASGEVSIRDCIERLAQEFKLTDEERAAPLPSGTQAIFRNRVQWAKTYLAKAGVVAATRRGPFVATGRRHNVAYAPFSSTRSRLLSDGPIWLSGHPPTRFGTPSPRTCSKTATTFAPSRNCWAIET